MRLREKARQLHGPLRLLVVASVRAEREAIERGITAAISRHASSSGPADRTNLVMVVEGGVGTAGAAATTAAALYDAEFTAVVCAGIAGGFAVPTGGLALGTASIAADLGADSPDGFLSIDELGLGSSTVECDADLVASLGERLPQAVRGSILTVSTVTGTAERAQALRERHPGAVAEAMEGFGVATAATRAGLPFAEVRAVSNAVGPRDRTSWRMDDALTALEQVGSALATLVP